MTMVACARTSSENMESMSAFSPKAELRPCYTLARYLRLLDMTRQASHTRSAISDQWSVPE